jgi:predicted  nucleic acid-binding Zn-ribbon protein
MPNMLTNEDLRAIGLVVDEKVGGLETRMNARFDAVDKRFEAIDKRFEAIDKRFEAIDKRFDGIEEQVASVQEQANVIQERVEGIENRMLTFDGLERYEIGQTERYDRRYVRKTA